MSHKRPWTYPHGRRTESEKILAAVGIKTVPSTSSQLWQKRKRNSSISCFCDPKLMMSAQKEKWKWELCLAWPLVSFIGLFFLPRCASALEKRHVLAHRLEESWPMSHGRPRHIFTWELLEEYPSVSLWKKIVEVMVCYPFEVYIPWPWPAVGCLESSLSGIWLHN